MAEHAEKTPADGWSLAGRRVWPELNRIEGAGGPLQVEPKVMALLETLVRRAGQVMTRRQLIDAVWQTEAVSDDVLTRAVGELRKIFDDDPARPRVIETIRGRGYRLVAEVAPASAPRPRHELAGLADRRAEALAAPARGFFSLRFSLAFGSALVILAVVAGFLRFQDGPQPREPATTAADTATPAGTAAPAGTAVPAAPFRVAPLTGSPGRDRDPAVSPDGTRIVFSLAEGEHGDSDLFMRLVDGGEVVRLTGGPDEDRLPQFSPDGTRVAFVRLAGARDCAYHVVAVTGGAPRRLVPCPPAGSVRFAWSPDGGSLAVSSPLEGGSPRVGLALLSLDTLEQRQLTAPAAAAIDLEPAFSPDGRWLAFTRSLHGRVSDLWVVPVAGGEAGGAPARRLTFDHRDVAGQTWSAEGEVIFSSDRGGSYSLWRVGLNGGAPRWIAGGGGKIKHPAHARQADVLAYEQWSYELNIWSAALSPGGGPAAEPAPVITSTQWDFGPSLSPDGRLAFTSNRSGSHELWLADAGGGEPRQLTALEASFTGHARWSPDGRSLVFVSWVGGRSDLYHLVLGDMRPRRLSADPYVEVAPSFSRDGQSVYFGSDRGGAIDLWRLPVEAGAGDVPTRVTTDGGSVGEQSWDGTALFYTKRHSPGLWRREVGADPQTPGEPISSEILEDLTSRFAVRPEGVYFVRWQDPPVLWLLPEGGEPRRVAELPDMDRSDFALAGDASHLLYARVDRAECDIMVARHLPH